MANCYIRFTVTAVRNSSDGSMQIADLNFYDANQTRVAYPSGTTISTNMSTYSGEGAENILDNNSSTKVCGGWPNSAIWFVITIPDESFLSGVKYYNYCTANDANGRDPISFTLEYSSDGTYYREIDTETNVTITTSRRTQTQMWECEMPAPFKTSGTAIISLANYTVGGDDALYWTATTPNGTSVAVATSVNNGTWQSIANGGEIQGLPTRGQTCGLRIRISLATTNTNNTPAVSGMIIRSADDKKILVLTPDIPNFSSAIGNMTISYDGLGGLRGRVGPTAAFTGTFTPAGLTWKGHQNDVEHIEVSTSANVALTHIDFYDAQETEHIEVSASATVTLTNIHDL